MPRYLVLDDNAHARLVLAKSLLSVRPGAEVVEASDVRSAVRIFREAPFDVVFLDVMMPGLNGSDALRAMREARPEALLVLVSGLAPSHPDLVDALLRRPFAALPKPFGLEELRLVLDAAEGGTR